MLDDQCSICCALQDALNNLNIIIKHIDWSCTGSRKKQDFGLSKNFIQMQTKQINNMQKWHEYHHSTGESLMDAPSNIESTSEQPRPRRFRQS